MPTREWHNQGALDHCGLRPYILEKQLHYCAYHVALPRLVSTTDYCCIQKNALMAVSLVVLKVNICALR